MMWGKTGQRHLPHLSDSVSRLPVVSIFFLKRLRLKFFVPPAVPQNILFFLLEETDPSASVIVLAAVHPKDRKNLVSGWKILVMVFEFYAYIFKVPNI